MLLPINGAVHGCPRRYDSEPLLALDNFVLTPHVAGLTEELIDLLTDVIIDSPA